MRALIILLALFVPLTVGAQISFERYYGGSSGDYAHSVEQTDDGGYITAGWTASFGVGGYDVWLIKTDQWGDTVWTRTYGGSGWDDGYSVEQTVDGGYIIGGYTDSFGAGQRDVYLVKTDGVGDTMWTRTYGGSYFDQGYSVEQTVDGGCIIGGYTDSFGPGLSDVYLIKTDSLGDTVWTRTYGGLDEKSAYSVEQTDDGGYIICGTTLSFGAGSGDVYLIKTDALGDTAWTQTYGGADTERAQSVEQTVDGGYIIAGETRSFGAGGKDFYLVKTDSLGDTLWTRTYGGSINDDSYSVQQTSDGGYIIAGETYSFGAGGADFYLVKTDSLGDTLWTRTYGGSDAEVAFSVDQTLCGGYIIAGQTRSFGAGGYDVYLVRTDSLGDTLWTRTYGGSDYDGGYSLKQTSDGGYVIAGFTGSMGAGMDDFYLIKTDADGLVGANHAPDLVDQACSAPLTVDMIYAAWGRA